MCPIYVAIVTDVSTKESYVDIINELIKINKLENADYIFFSLESWLSYPMLHKCDCL